MVSERKRQANGRNAKLSTGPTDTRRTRYNAQKHGLLSKATIIETGDAQEDPRELESLFSELWEDLEPVGKMEEILVDQIVSCVWRKRRAQRAEVGEIRRGADSAGMDARDSIADRFESALQRLDMSFVPGSGGWSKRELEKTTLGIARIQSVLKLMRAIVEKRGSLTEDDLAKVKNIYGTRDDSLAFAISAVSSMATSDLQERDDEEQSTWGDTPSPEKCKETLLAFIDWEIARLTDEADLVAERENLEWDVAVLSRHLPSDEVLGKILRYETAIDRQMYRALKELRELQAARRARSTRPGTSDNGV